VQLRRPTHRGFGEGGVAAQIAKHDDDLASMAFEDLLVTVRDDEFGKLRREKALQSSDATQFVNLGGDTRLQIAVQLPDLLGALPQLAQQSRVFHRDDCLRCEILDQRDLLVGEWKSLVQLGFSGVSTPFG
jgi:hypothetical protein